VKVPVDLSGEEEVGAATAFHEAAHAAGVPTPQVRRTAEGRVFAIIGGTQVRVYEWVDPRAPDPRLDPALVGAAVAAIHRVGSADLSPLDPWYHEPVDAARWDDAAPGKPAGTARPPAGSPSTDGSGDNR
jgi:hypothetical protein